MQNWFLSVFIAAQQEREWRQGGRIRHPRITGKNHFSLQPCEKTEMIGNIRIDIWLNRNRHIVIIKRAYMALYDIKCISSRSGAGDMMRKILSSLAVLFGFLLLANALPSEMMEEKSLDLLGDFSDEMQKEIDADNSLHDANVTGAWSIDLMGEQQEKMKLNLLQNGSLISGQGVIIQGDETVKATASGSISGLEMNLAVVPEGVPDIYRLNLTLSSLAGGQYAVHQVDGGSRSGRFKFAVSANIFRAASAEDEWEI